MQRPEVSALVALGANLGDPVRAVRQALQALNTAPGMRLREHSRLYRSAPVDAGGPDFINAVAQVTTTLSAPALLQGLQAIEAAAGRERLYRHAARTLDLDLLFYGDAQIASPALTVPHPRLHERAFVLLPLAEIAPGRVQPQWLAAVAGQAIERLGD